MYYPCSENKGADQLRGYREADLRLCFRIGNNPVFSRCSSNGVCHIAIEPYLLFCTDKISISTVFAKMKSVIYGCTDAIWITGTKIKLHKCIHNKTHAFVCPKFLLQINWSVYNLTDDVKSIL